MHSHSLIRVFTVHLLTSCILAVHRTFSKASAQIYRVHSLMLQHMYWYSLDRLSRNTVLSISGISVTSAKPSLWGPGYIVMCVRILIYVMGAILKNICHLGKLHKNFCWLCAFWRFSPLSCTLLQTALVTEQTVMVVLQSILSLSWLRLSWITTYFEVKIWSLFATWKSYNKLQNIVENNLVQKFSFEYVYLELWKSSPDYGQLSVSGERMCTILVNRLED